MPDQSGPDVPEIVCWVPTGCCLPNPCNITQEQFICAVRSLLPEGEIYNNTRQKLFDPLRPVGVVTIGCARIGCEQQILGSCCADVTFCDEDPPAPQLAVVDSFAAVAYGFIEALCKMLGELDPCTSDLLREAWGKRLGIIKDDPCEPQWSDKVLRELLCIIPTLRNKIWNWERLQVLGERFGAAMTLRSAGDFSDCGPLGWWTMARDRPPDCEPMPSCENCVPTEALLGCECVGEQLVAGNPWPVPWIHMAGTCQDTPPESHNLILCPSDIRYDTPCQIVACPPPAPEALVGCVTIGCEQTAVGQPLQEVRLPHDPEMYRAFKWLLPQILPQPVYWCIYDCDEGCKPPPEALVGCLNMSEQMATGNPESCITL